MGKIANATGKQIAEVRGILSCTLSLKFVFLLGFWHNILLKCDCLSKYLQNPNLNLNTACMIIKNTLLELKETRNPLMKSILNITKRQKKLRPK